MLSEMLSRNILEIFFALELGEVSQSNGNLFFILHLLWFGSAYHGRLRHINLGANAAS